MDFASFLSLPQGLSALNSNLGKQRKSAKKHDIEHKRGDKHTLGSNENELTVLHFFGNMNQRLDGELAHFCVEKNIKFIQNPEGCLERLPQCKKQAHRGVTSFTPTVIQKKNSSQ